MAQKSKQVVVISGPTGSGESTITNELVRLYPKKVQRLVTATTRPPRAGERNGEDYYFFSKEEFNQATLDGRIPEYTYIKNRDTYYGSYAPDLDAKLAAGSIIVVNADIVGAKFYKERYGATTIFIIPENIKALERRIRDRSPELTEEEIAHRRDNAKKEIQTEQAFYDHTVVNADGKLSEAIDAVVSILKKEGYGLSR